MKKKIIKILLVIELLLILLNIHHLNLSFKENKGYLDTLSYTDNIFLNNSDIVGSIKIAGKKYVLVQGSDNEFYLNHDINKKESEFGTLFLDYRCNLFNKESCAIYGHSSNFYDLPFNVISKYTDFDFLNNNKLIEIIYYNNLFTYEIIGITNSYKTYTGNNILYLQTCKPNASGILLLVAIKK